MGRGDGRPCAGGGGAGFTGLGIAADKIDADAIAAYAETGLRCPEILALLFTDDVQTTVASAEHLAVQAEAIGAAWVLTVFTSPLTSAMEKALRRRAGVFADAGAGMAIEFSPLGPISSINNGVDVVRAANRGRGRAGRMMGWFVGCMKPRRRSGARGQVEVR